MTIGKDPVGMQQDKCGQTRTVPSKLMSRELGSICMIKVARLKMTLNKSSGEDDSKRKMISVRRQCFMETAPVSLLNFTVARTERVGEYSPRACRLARIN
uniref:Uncharacterized protein n=1 Tax=Salix viminalis TaxID=40686 RepID=A0A6N2JXZ2_SALVM